MTTLQKIRKEIERLVKLNKCTDGTSFAKGVAAGYADVLSFLDTLQEPEVDLSEETEKQYNARSSHDNLVHLTKSGFEWFAKHFYELGKQSSDRDCPKIKGWIAVDILREERRVSFFPKPPVRDLLTDNPYWAAHISPYDHIVLDSSLFPDLKWEDEPRECELNIRLL